MRETAIMTASSSVAIATRIAIPSVTAEARGAASAVR